MMNGQPPSLETAARTLLLVILIVLGVMIYAYGWDTTNINLEAPRNENRQSSVKRGIRELLSPNIFDQEFSVEQSATVNFQRGCIEGESVEQPDHDSGDPYLEIDRECGGNDEIVKITGHDFDFNSRNVVLIRWIAPATATRVEEVISFEQTYNLRRDGTFEGEIAVPRIRASQGALHIIQADIFEPTGSLKFSDTSETVWDKMVETIFLALMATTLAVPVATAISFLAARNLMRQVTMPVGNVLISLMLLPIGWFLGWRFLGPLGKDGVLLGRESVFHLIGTRVDLIESLHPLPSIVAPMLIVTTAFYGLRAANEFIRSGLSDEPLDRNLKYISTAIHNLLWVAAGILTLGILGGLLIYFGNELKEIRLLQSLGMMLATIGELIEILTAPMAGLAIALVVASTGSTLTIPLLKPIRGVWSNVIGAILGAAVGAILIGIFTALSIQAALLIVVPLFIAAILGWQIVMQAYRRLQQNYRPSFHSWRGEETLVQVLGFIGSLVALIVAFQLLNASRGLIDGRRPLSQEISIIGIDMRVHLLLGIVLGAILGGINWGLIGIQSSMPLGLVIYNSTRTTLNILRSIEPLMMGIVFVIWVGAGPFAGVLALTLHSIAALGKLYSEQVENIDPGPIEAIQSTGANRLQTIIYAVVPQIVPPYIAFTLYRWDINVRMSTIIGFVGGGGIGFILNQQINLLQYQDAGVALLAIAFVVSVLDYTSAFVRARMI